LVGANRAADQILRIDHFHILGRPIEEAFPGLVGTDIPNAYRQLAAQGGHLEREEVQYHHGQIEGAYHIHAFATGPNRMTVFFRDITERKRVERALVESQERYRLLIERSPDAIMIIQGDKLVFANPAALCLLGARSGEDLLGLTSEQVVHPEDRPAARDRVKRLATGESGLYPAEVRFLRRDGTDVWVEVIGTLIEYAGQPAVQLVARDISERKQAEAEREKLQGQLTQAQKMESVGRLAGGVAHDFNNMLQVILGNTALALTEVSADSPLRECLEEIQSSAQRSADLTRQLLAFARKQTIAPKVVDLNTAVAGMLKMLRRLIGEGIELAWLPGPDLGFVHVDPSQVDQILANLCVNARDAITSGLGKVTLETANVTIDEASLAEHPDARAGEYVRLSVSDNGCGLNPEVRAHLFEPFFTTKGLGQGTGLGLATVYGIVRQNNGFIIVSSEPGRGSTFLIHLPRHLPKILHSLQSTAPVPGGGQETILLVEDEPAILRVTRRLLEDLGYKVLAASTPGEGIQIAREHVGEIHLLLTDVVMPEMNGRDLARSLLGQYPNLKRLFMSGHTADVIAHHGVLDPGVHFIQKPYSVQVLADKVREALNRDG
jgi:PAS domain S-box-containing protein